MTNTTGYFFLGLILTFLFAFLGEGVNFLHKKYYPTVYQEACLCKLNFFIQKNKFKLIKRRRIRIGSFKAS